MKLRGALREFINGLWSVNVPFSEDVVTEHNLGYVEPFTADTQEGGFFLFFF